MIDSEKVDLFLTSRRDLINSTNQSEFQNDLERDSECSRCSPATFQGKIQVLVADNKEGPLGKSLRSTRGKLISPHGIPSYPSNRSVYESGIAVEDRLEGLESHLGFVLKAEDKKVMERIKILEEKILRIEENYPQIAAHVFNYGKAEEMASRRPGGRVSRMASAGVTNQSGVEPNETIDRSSRSLDELRRRMRILKQKLTLKKEK